MSKNRDVWEEEPKFAKKKRDEEGIRNGIITSSFHNFYAIHSFMLIWGRRTRREQKVGDDERRRHNSQNRPKTLLRRCSLTPTQKRKTVWLFTHLEFDRVTSSNLFFSSSSIRSQSIDLTSQVSCPLIYN